MPEAAGDVGGGLAAIVLEIERGAARNQRLDRRLDVVNARGRIVARGPHQCGEAVGVAAVDVDPGLDEQRDDRSVGVPRGVNHRALALVVERIGVGAVFQEPLDAVRRTIVGGRVKRAQTLAARKVGIGATLEQQLDRRAAIRFGGVEERRRAVDGPRVGVGAALEKQPDQRQFSRLSRSAKRGRAIAIARIDRRAAIDERARLSLAAEPRSGEQERRRLVFIALMQLIHGFGCVGATVRRAR
jgi:hypothetical protein